MFIVGIDVAKRNHEVTVITSAGQVVCKGFRISNTCTGYNRMMERLGKLTNLKSQFIFAMESTFCKTALAVLTKYPTPDKLSRAQLGKLTEVLQKSSNGRFGEWKAREIKELARGSFGVADCEGVYSTLIQLFLEQIHTLLETCSSLERQINELLLQFDTTRTTIPGVGTLLAATILSEIGDISRFSSADKLAAYIGVDPAVNQSGEFVGSHVHMSKRGSPYLRRAVWMASMIAVQRDPMFKAYYEKKASEGLRYMNIIGHVTKKMTAVIYAIMRDNKAYVPVMPVVA